MPLSIGNVIQNLLGGGSTPPPATGPGSNPSGGYADPGYAGYVGPSSWQSNATSGVNTGSVYDTQSPSIVNPSQSGGATWTYIPGYGYVNDAGGGPGSPNVGDTINQGGQSWESNAASGAGHWRNDPRYGRSQSSLANGILAWGQAMHQPVNYTGNDRETNPRFYPGGGWQGRVVDGTVMRVAAPPVNFGLRPPTDRAALSRFIYGSGARRNFLRGGGG